MLADQRAVPAPVIHERQLRRQIDNCVARALFDQEYANLLLADPTTVLEDRDCPPQEYLSLRSINASNLLEFAEQAQALFWGSARGWLPSSPLLTNDDVGELARHHDNSLHAGPSDVLLDARQLEH